MKKAYRFIAFVILIACIIPAFSASANTSIIVCDEINGEELWLLSSPVNESCWSRDVPMRVEVNGFWYDYTTDVTTNGLLNVAVYTTADDYSPQRIDQMIREINQLFPEIEIIGDPTSQYNCHSYAWYNASVYNPYCIFDIGNYIDDVHTYHVPDGAPLRTGDIVVYNNVYGIAHSAIITEIKTNGEIICTSKWGANVLCEHAIGYVPGGYKNNNVLDYEIYRKMPHDYTITSNSTSHTFSCNDCPYMYSQAHALDLLGKCRICGYSGPITAENRDSVVLN